MLLLAVDQFSNVNKKYKPYYLILYLGIFQLAFGANTLLPIYLNPFGTAFWAWVPIDNSYNMPFVSYALVVVSVFILIVKIKIDAHPPV
jgi:hypothetical protein